MKPEHVCRETSRLEDGFLVGLRRFVSSSHLHVRSVGLFDKSKILFRGSPDDLGRRTNRDRPRWNPPPAEYCGADSENRMPAYNDAVENYRSYSDETLVSYSTSVYYRAVRDGNTVSYDRRILG